MKIKRVEEINEDHNESDKVQLFKKLLNDIWTAKNDQESFDIFWKDFGNKYVTDLGISDSKHHGNVREVLPQMVQISNNSQITQQTAQRIVDKFEKNELMDFKRWLQLIK